MAEQDSYALKQHIEALSVVVIVMFPGMRAWIALLHLFLFFGAFACFCSRIRICTPQIFSNCDGDIRPGTEASVALL